MKLSTAVPALFVKNIEVSKKFYTETLKLNIALDFGKNITFKEGFAIWELRENHIIPEKLGLNSVADNSKNNFELYFETSNFEAIEQILEKSDICFVHKKHEEPWGQYTLRFFDPDMHLIEIGETLQSFVLRFKTQGMSLNEISTKTHIPINTIKQLLS